MTVNFMAGALLFGFANEVIRNPAWTEQWTKLIMAPPFLWGAGAALVLVWLWAPGLSASKRWLGLDHRRPLPENTAPRDFFRAPEAWVALLLLLPPSVQILGAELETLSRLAFPYPAFYASLQELLSPKGSAVDLIGAFATLALIGPICEELLFRGMILGGFLKIAGDRTPNSNQAASTRPGVNLFWPVLFQAFLFALVHLNPWQFAYALPMGYLFGWLRVRSGSLWPCIVLHCGNNLLAIILVYFAPPIQFLNSGIYSSIEHVPVPLLLLAGVLCALAIFLLERRARIITRPSEVPAA